MLFFVQTLKEKKTLFCMHSVQLTVVLLHAVTWQSTLVLLPKLHLHCNKKRAAPVYHTGVTLVVYIPKEQQRVTGNVCTIQAALSQACLGTPELQTAGQVQTSCQESLGSQHLEECTGADTLQQTIPANT